MPSQKVVNEQPPHSNKRLSDLTVAEYLELQRWISKRDRIEVRVKDIAHIAARISSKENKAEI